MLKLTLATIALGLGIAVPASGMLSPRETRVHVEEQLLARMNGSPAGRITRAVRCREAGSRSAFDCSLVSTAGTKLGAGVRVTGGAVETTWQPLRG